MDEEGDHDAGHSQEDQHQPIAAASTEECICPYAIHVHERTEDAILAITPEAVAGTPLAAIPADKLESLSGFMPIPFFLALFIATTVESVQLIIQLINRRPPALFEAKK